MLTVSEVITSLNRSSGSSESESPQKSWNARLYAGLNSGPVAKRKSFNNASSRSAKVYDFVAAAVRVQTALLELDAAAAGQGSFLPTEFTDCLH